MNVIRHEKKQPQKPIATEMIESGRLDQLGRKNWLTELVRSADLTNDGHKEQRAGFDPRRRVMIQVGSNRQLGVSV